MDFNGFVLYKIYKNGNIVVNHVVKDNSKNAFENIINTMQEKWHRRKENVTDIILLPLPCIKPYSIDKPIYRGIYIDTEEEFEYKEFENKYYGK